jgi:alkyl sulfatase BDS1-like metallo-beta-lactamase superfamily hydrolase
MTSTFGGRVIAALSVLALLAGQSLPALAGDPASATTVAAQAAFAKDLPAEDRQDFDFATRGFVGNRADPKIRRADGQVVWDLSAYDFLNAPPPATVNPSLWRQAQLLSKSGLFKVSDHIWQVRGFDISNITFVKGDTGWIVIDPLTTVEVARAALELANEKLGPRPVVAVIYTHPHGDHFGGARGVVDGKDVDSGKVKVIAPVGFLEHAVSENVLAGVAMSRRASYQFGSSLPMGVDGQVSSGIGQGIAKGQISLIPPTVNVDHTGQEMVVDGVKMVFQLTPGTEAPAEMNLFFPDWRILDMAENANASMHNILTPRGALVRDAKAWADYLTQSIRLFGPDTDTMITSHGWPRFGHEVVIGFLENHRDAYKYLHDQTVRMMNDGLTGTEIADRLQLPPALARDWYNHGYYGTMRFNSRAVYQRYMGWYDANPVHLMELAPADEGRHYVEAMGGPKKVIALARKAYAAGDYRWAATLLNDVVMADAGNVEAKTLLARVYDQMGYQAESAIWRNMYLTGAMELRGGIPPSQPTTAGLDLIRNMPTDMLFDLMAVRLNPAKVGEGHVTLEFVFPERNERFYVQVRNGVLIAEPIAAPGPVDATLTLPRALLIASLFTGAPLAPAVASGQAKVEGDIAALSKMAGWFEAPKGGFPIVTRP